jgi:hypothetical protein
MTLTAWTSSREAWVQDLKSHLERIDGYEFVWTGPGEEPGQVVLVSSRLPELKAVLDKISRQGRVVFLVQNEHEDLSPFVQNGQVDDVWVTPFRFSEVYSKIRQYQRLMSWGEVHELNDSLTTLVEKFQEDLELASRLQKAKFPERFPQIKGFQVKSRYYAGLRAGGDYFDIAEAKNQKQLSLFLTDSSSYGLSSAVLGAMMKVAMRLTSEEATSTAGTVRKIYNELLMTLGEREELSLFFGTIRRADLSLQYVNYGNTRAFLARPGRTFEVLPVSGHPINRKGGTPKADESSVVLQPEDRLLVLSDGYLASGESWESFLETLNALRDREPTEILNELGFRVKSQSQDEDGFPPQDCSAVLLDVSPNVLRIAG